MLYDEWWREYKVLPQVACFTFPIRQRNLRSGGKNLHLWTVSLVKP
jgi:hypothetical protein